MTSLQPAAQQTGLESGIAKARLSSKKSLWRNGDGSLATAVASICGGLLLWEVAARFIVGNPLFLAAPSQVAMQIGELLSTGELQRHMAVSGTEFGIGLVISIVLGIVLGFILASSPTARKIIGPWVACLYATPTIAVAPLIILWFGIDIWSKVVVVVVNAVFPMIINTETGLRATDRKLVETVECFGATKFQVFWNVQFPSAIPYILAGIRLAVGRAIVSVVVGELFGARAGLGFMLAQASEVFNMPRLFAAVVVLASAGLLLTSLAQAAERGLQPWNRV
jgi:NitT/TauT family transport system permease protein